MNIAGLVNTVKSFVAQHVRKVLIAAGVVAVAVVVGLAACKSEAPKPVEKPAPTKVEPKKPQPKVAPKPVQKPAQKPAQPAKPKKVKQAPAKVDCEMVRRAKRLFSPEHLEHLKREYGITPAQEREYRKCL